MTASLPIPTRMLVLLGVALLAAAAFLVARPVLLSEDDGTVATPTPTPPVAVTPARPTPATPATPAKPKVALLPGLPAPVANKLRRSKVVVVSVYTGTSASDRTAVAQARTGARSTGAAFVALNVLDETRARAIQSFAGTMSTPSLLVVKRPGRVVTRIEGMPDSQIVAQAAHNAGARRR